VLSLRDHRADDGSLISSAVSRIQDRKDGKLVLFLDDADFLVTGSNHFIQAGVSRAHIMIVFFNSYVYRIFREHRNLGSEQEVSGSPHAEVSPCNIPRLARICGASYAARWTAYHPRRFAGSLIRGLTEPGFSVVEMISPCYMYYPNIGSFGETIDKMALLKANARLRKNESVDAVTLGPGSDYIVGEFDFNEA
jgi:2-oxoglutarate ferredoxin oxidoreductase subunit beta